LIFSGSRIERELTGSANPQFIVGVFQQLVQASIGIILFHLIFKAGIKELGINLRNKRLSIKYFLFFALFWSLIIGLYLLAAYFFFPNTWLLMKSLELPPKDVIMSTLLFQSFFPGFGEEILFRGFFIAFLSAFVLTGAQESNGRKIGIIVLSSLYFALAHVYFTVAPFRLTHVDYLQLVTAFGCGAFYAAVFLKTRSLLAPFSAHNFANTSATICGYIISVL
jgi:membrane protease YdiL (CAAX protease family)